MGNPVGHYFHGIVKMGKYGDPIVRLPEGNAAVTYGFPHQVGDRVTIFVYGGNNDGSSPTGFFAEVLEVKGNNLRASTGV